MRAVIPLEDDSHVADAQPEAGTPSLRGDVHVTPTGIICQRLQLTADAFRVQTRHLKEGFGGSLAESQVVHWAPAPIGNIAERLIRVKRYDRSYGAGRRPEIEYCSPMTRSDRMEGESARAFHAFKRYLEFPPAERSIDAAWGTTRPRGCTKNSGALVAAVELRSRLA